MAFESLKEQLRDNWADLSGKIQENSTFNNLREKFEEQSPTVQRAIIGGAAGLFVLFMLSFPWGYVSESQDHMTDFEDNRSLIQGLLHASRAAKEPSPLPAPLPVDNLRGQVDNLLRENRLIPDQIGEIAPLPDKPARDLAPGVVIQTGLAVQLKKLNLDQIMNLSHGVENMGPGTKLMGVDLVQSGSQDHYYDMNMRVVAFALPPASSMEEEPQPKKGGKIIKKPRKTDEEGGE